MAMQLIIYTFQLDLIVSTILLCDKLSGVAPGLVGSLVMAPVANIDDGTAMFETVHGSVHDIPGQKIAIPSAVILGTVKMLDYLGELNIMRRIGIVLSKIIEEKKFLTSNINSENNMRTSEIAETIYGLLE
jgi:isocitrate/isopropylmalate dehydrogenase